MKVNEFDFDLPASFIAQRPEIPRDNCRLLVLRRDGSIEHRRFFHLPEYLDEGDLLLLNNTKVFPARLIGTKKKTGGKIEILLVREIGPDRWEILSRENYTGTVTIAGELSGEMVCGRSLTFTDSSITAVSDKRDGSKLMKTLWKIGLMPLPPYIKRKPDELDKETYQTVYAQKVGSIAAPTAGIHFTDELMSVLEKKGVAIRFLTLHIGTGTFKPVRGENIEEHRMEEEYFEIDRDLIETIKGVKECGKRVITVGTTSTRAVEGFFCGQWAEISDRNFSHYAPSDNPPQSPLNLRGDERGVIKGFTDIFIHPGYQFRVIDSIVTNLHLPRSTPLMLTAALSGRENLMNAYRSARAMEYRFFSYGDAMLIS